MPMAGWVAAGTLRTGEEQKERFDFAELFDRETSLRTRGGRLND